MKKWNNPTLTQLSIQSTYELWHQGWQCQDNTCSKSSIQYGHGTDYWSASRAAASDAMAHFYDTKAATGVGHGYSVTCQPELCSCS